MTHFAASVPQSLASIHRVSAQSLVCSPGSSSGTVRTADGQVLTVPAGWELLPPGDATLTRRVKAAGPTWTVQEKKGRKVFSRGVWADAATIESVRQQLAAERETPEYARQRQSQLARREKKQTEYVGSFHDAVLAFLAFDDRHSDIAARMAEAVTTRATPVGSGTVARTERIPIEKRAEAAVIAWMRHQTTAYDSLSIPRVKGKRREVRRQLAAESKRLLHAYRIGQSINPTACPLQRALSEATSTPRSPLRSPPSFPRPDAPARRVL